MFRALLAALVAAIAPALGGAASSIIDAAAKRVSRVIGGKRDSADGPDETAKGAARAFRASAAEGGEAQNVEYDGIDVAGGENGTGL